MESPRHLRPDQDLRWPPGQLRCADQGDAQPTNITYEHINQTHYNSTTSTIATNQKTITTNQGDAHPGPPGGQAGRRGWRLPGQPPEAGAHAAEGAEVPANIINTYIRQHKPCNIFNTMNITTQLTTTLIYIYIYIQTKLNMQTIKHNLPNAHNTHKHNEHRC